MLICERCASSFSSLRAPRSEHCPRCFARDGTRVPLVFKLIPAAPLGPGPTDDRRVERVAATHH